MVHAGLLSCARGSLFLLHALGAHGSCWFAIMCERQSILASCTWCSWFMLVCYHVREAVYSCFMHLVLMVHAGLLSCAGGSLFLLHALGAHGSCWFAIMCGRQSILASCTWCSWFMLVCYHV